MQLQDGFPDFLLISIWSILTYYWYEKNINNHMNNDHFEKLQHWPTKNKGQTCLPPD